MTGRAVLRGNRVWRAWRLGPGAECDKVTIVAGDAIAGDALVGEHRRCSETAAGIAVADTAIL